MNWAFKVRNPTSEEIQVNTKNNNPIPCDYIITVVGGELDGVEYAAGKMVTIEGLIERMTKDIILRGKIDKFKFKGIQDFGEES
jgi:hypothetical protein